MLYKLIMFNTFRSRLPSGETLFLVVAGVVAVVVGRFVAFLVGASRAGSEPLRRSFARASSCIHNILWGNVMRVSLGIDKR